MKTRDMVNLLNRAAAWVEEHNTSGTGSLEEQEADYLISDLTRAADDLLPVEDVLVDSGLTGHLPAGVYAKGGK